LHPVLSRSRERPSVLPLVYWPQQVAVCSPPLSCQDGLGCPYGGRKARGRGWDAELTELFGVEGGEGLHLTVLEVGVQRLVGPNPTQVARPTTRDSKCHRHRKKMQLKNNNLRGADQEIAGDRCAVNSGAPHLMGIGSH